MAKEKPPIGNDRRIKRLLTILRITILTQPTTASRCWWWTRCRYPSPAPRPQPRESDMNVTMKSEQGEDAMTIHEELEEMKREIAQTELYSKARGKLSAPALELVERAYRELPAEEADAVRREILEALRT